MARANSSGSQQQLSVLLKRLLVWLPLIVGIIHQFMMLLWGIEGIYVFVNPPEYIYPWVSLEFQWWIVLFFAAGLMFVLLFLNRLTSIPHRVVYPVYVYLVFLLIFVKPI